MGQRDGSHDQSSLHPGTPTKILSDHPRAIAGNATEYFDQLMDSDDQQPGVRQRDQRRSLSEIDRITAMQPTYPGDDSRRGWRVTQEAEQARLGITPAPAYLVHSSLRRIAPTPSGPAGLLALLQAELPVGSTLVVPTTTTQTSTTTRRFRALTAGMSPEQVAAEENKIEAYSFSATPAQDVGYFAEFLRCRPGAVRSDHPQTSFAALGPLAADLMHDHRLDSHLGEHSPLARLYAVDAVVLLLGVGFDVCTCFHLAEHRLPAPAQRRQFSCYVLENGLRVRREFMAPEADDSDFAQIGEAMADASFVHRAPFASAMATWFPIRAAVDFAATWMSDHRSPYGGRQ